MKIGRQITVIVLILTLKACSGTRSTTDVEYFEAPKPIADSTQILDTRTVAKDTSDIRPRKAPFDSLLATLIDTVAPDTSRQTAESGLDTMIYYGADTTLGSLEDETIYLKGNAWVKYQTMHLEAAHITVHHPTKTLLAEAVPDSVDSLGNVVRYRGTPTFTEGGESFRGFKMEYNFRTRRGRITKGETEYQKGYYYGDKITKVGQKTLYIKNGRFTTCDKPHPHFFFQTKEMKILVKEKVIARPIILYIHEVPIFALPFGVFPSKGERQSGLTSPTYNETSEQGRQLRNVGFYYAPNDHWDALLQVDFLDKTGFIWHGGVRYSKRYHFNGDVQGSFSDLEFVDEDKFRRWNIDARHNQTIDETSNVNADIHFVSNKSFYEETSLNEDQILNRQLRSNITANKTFGWGSISTNLNQTENLDTGQKSWTLPSIAISKTSSTIFAKNEPEPGETETEDRWYHSIRYSYNANALQKGSQASTGADRKRETGIEHSFGISAPQKIFKHLTVTPNFNLRETWFTERREGFSVVDSTNETIFDKNKGFFARHTFSTGASMTTKLYGTVNPELYAVKTLRHVATPTVSFTYQPDFSTSRWNYYESVIDTAGIKSKEDRYRNSILFGGTPRGRRLTMGFGVSNLFQGKFQGKNDSTESKLDLFTYDLSSSYNFAADSFRVANLSSSLSVSNDIARVFTLRMGFIHDFYKFDKKLNRRVRDFQYIPRLTSLTVTAGLKFNNAKSGGASSPPPPNSFQSNRDYNERLNPKETLLPQGVPWRANFDFSFRLNRVNPTNTSKDLNMNTSIGASLTENWEVSYNARVDVLEKEVVSQRFSFLRNLHCWELRFDWTPSGPTSGFFFIIQVKSSDLRDIKVQKTDYDNRIF